MLALVGIFGSGCGQQSSVESKTTQTDIDSLDWEAASKAATAEAYGAYVHSHPEGKHAEQAEFSRAEIQGTAAAYIAFLKKYPDTKLLQVISGKVESYMTFKDQLIWVVSVDGNQLPVEVGTNEAVTFGLASGGDNSRNGSYGRNINVNYSGKTIPKARVIMKKSGNLKKIVAVDPIVTGKSPSTPLKRDVKADSVQIAYVSGIKMIGGIRFKLGTDSTLGPGEAQGPVKVMIFREIDPQSLETAKKWGVKVGGAYIQTGQTQYEYIKDVDLALSDEELAKQFGVESK